MNSREKAEQVLKEVHHASFRDIQIDIVERFLDEHAAEQREACANAITEHFAAPKKLMSLQEVCLNATREES